MKLQIHFLSTIWQVAVIQVVLFTYLPTGLCAPGGLKIYPTSSRYGFISFLNLSVIIAAST